jgi:Caspase domain
MKLIVTALLIISNMSVYSFEKYALLIGIDQYKAPPGFRPTGNGRSYFKNLKGCKNDAEAMYSVLSSKFQFQQQQIDTLFDNSASRQGILEAMHRLLQKAKAGDYAVIYFAGHGSRVRNSLSFEADKTDQSIVPSDTWKEGVHDIRDKELSAIFNQFLDKEVFLTVILDCCHSGSMSRGPNLPPLEPRFFPGENWDAKDAIKPRIPEEREGNRFLIISAAQSNELAEEHYDGDIPHGAFTTALIKAINQQSANESSINLFLAARAILKSFASVQEPAIGGSVERQEQTLFGITKGTLPDYTQVAVTVTDTVENKVQLQGGYALGLYPQNELTLFGAGNDTIAKLRVDTITGINSCIASLVKGQIQDVKPGLFFRITNWVSDGRPLLHVFIPTSSLADTTVLAIAKTAALLKTSKLIKWQPTFSKGDKTPYTSVFWSGAACYIRTAGNEAVELTTIDTASILSYCKKDSTLYMELPVSGNDAAVFEKRVSQNRSILVVKEFANAHYTLYGRLGDNELPAYGFRKKYVTGKDSLESLPITTDCFEWPLAGVNKSIADSLFDRVSKISKIRGWLSLETPDLTRTIPGYHLEFINEKTKKRITGNSYKIGDYLTLKLVADATNNTKLTPDLKTWFIYVFGLDQTGAMTLYYPSNNDGNVTNKFPKFVGDVLVKEITLVGPYKVPAPSGTDNFFLLACEEPINNASVIFNQESIYTGMGTRDNNNPLANLLEMGNVSSRNATPKTLPANWSLQKISFKCTY